MRIIVNGAVGGSRSIRWLLLTAALVAFCSAARPQATATKAAAGAIPDAATARKRASYSTLEPLSGKDVTCMRVSVAFNPTPTRSTLG